jgi:hypothetical protein
MLMTCLEIFDVNNNGLPVIMNLNNLTIITPTVQLELQR